MLEVLFENGIVNEYTQKMILGVALILKRNSKDKIKSLKELNNLVNTEVLTSVEYLGETRIVKIINELLRNEEKDLVNVIIKEAEVKSVFNMETPKTEAEIMDYLLNIKDGADILDLYSGEGKIEEVLLKNHKNIKVDGFELNDGALEIAKLKMYALKNDSVQYFKKDILLDNIEKKYQYAVADIPFISRFDKEVQKKLEKACIDLNIKLSGRISITWITIIKILSSLKSNGRAVITTMKGSLFNTLDREIRKELVESGIEENNKKYIGTYQKVLVEGESKNNKDMLTGRTDSNKVVVFEGSKDLINKIVDLKIVSEHMWYLKGKIDE